MIASILRAFRRVRSTGSTVGFTVGPVEGSLLGGKATVVPGRELVTVWPAPWVGLWCLRPAVARNPPAAASTITNAATATISTVVVRLGRNAVGDGGAGSDGGGAAGVCAAVCGAGAPAAPTAGIRAVPAPAQPNTEQPRPSCQHSSWYTDSQLAQRSTETPSLSAKRQYGQLRPASVGVANEAVNRPSSVSRRESCRRRAPSYRPEV